MIDLSCTAINSGLITLGGDSAHKIDLSKSRFLCVEYNYDKYICFIIFIVPK